MRDVTQETSDEGLVTFLFSVASLPPQRNPVGEASTMADS